MAEKKSNEEILKERAAAATAQAAANDAPAELFPNPQVDMPPELLSAMRGESTDTAIATLPDDGRDYSREMDQSDVTFPRVRLTQGTSKAALDEDNPVPLGNWHYSQGNINLGKSIQVIVMDMFKTRALFVQNAGLMCRSLDFRMGIGQPGGVCMNCTLKDWRKPENGQGSNRPPLCSVNYNYLAVVKPDAEFAQSNDELDEAFPAMLLFSRTSAKLAKEINTKRMQNRTRPWEYWTFTLGRISSKNTLGNFYVPVVEGVSKTTQEDLAWVDSYRGEMDDDSIRAAVNRTLDSDDTNDDDDD